LEQRLQELRNQLLTSRAYYANPVGKKGHEPPIRDVKRMIAQVLTILRVRGMKR
jgi:ribosomal protein L29